MMEGYLQMWQGFLSQWNRYYFRIHEEMLLFGPKKQEIEGRIHLKVATIITKLDEPISLIIHTGTDTIYLKAFSIDEKVRWYKKLKQAQKQSIDSSHNKQFFKMQVEFKNSNRFKILDDLNTELWKCHAELQQRFDELIVKTKSIIAIKNVDRLRMIIDEFKFKMSQMLNFIDEELRNIKSGKEREVESVRYTSNRGSSRKNHHTKMDENYHQMRPPKENNFNNTQFFSFEAKNLKDEFQNRNVSYFDKISENTEKQNSLSSLSLELRQKNTRLQSSKVEKYPRSRDFTEDLHKEKINLINYNPVFLKYKDRNIITSTLNRKKLPEKYTPEEKFPVFSTLKNAISSKKNFSQSSMPILINEPLTTLQKGFQQLYYADLLTKADEQQDENLRILFVAAFAVSSYSLNQYRIKKSINPLLGQTFQFIDESRGIQYISEHVSLNPPISAFYARSNNFQFFDNSKAKETFTGNTIRIDPQSKIIIKLQKHNDFYIINKCSVSLNNILIGKTNIEIYGKLVIKCKDFDTQVTIDFPQDTFWKKNSPNEIQGYMKSLNNTLYNLSGSWNKEILAESLQNKKTSVLWKKNHPINSQYYYFNDLALQLNNLTYNNCKSLPPTDSRFRPDQRALEFRDLQLAEEEKNRIYQKQTRRKNDYAEIKQEHKILWFRGSVMQGQNVFLSTQKYWDQKIKGKWSDCVNLY